MQREIASFHLADDRTFRFVLVGAIVEVTRLVNLVKIWEVVGNGLLGNTIQSEGAYAGCVDEFAASR